MKKAIHIPATTLPVMESFYTLQGEGAHQGKAAYFIRLGGCDVGCVWCDVKESWDADAHPQKSIDTIVNTALQAIPAGYKPNDNSKVIAVITGGEPLLYDLELLTKALQVAGFRTHIETSGSSNMSGVWDWVCLSPKKFKAPLPEVVSLADELKIIIYNKSDFAWGEKFAALANADCKLYLQPEWSKAAVVTPMIIDYIKANPQWQMSLQVHKYINVP
ncbi:7-carboxy-7-deazaguanine synthase QueE [Agriterribacter humi]|uniref:7-carboxy-7-deazaguanine synthase QueE n=1 Tax=Agriterribacter humi TaxID=1104781 RepID=UPI001D033210|nr:7-carboxy-7-deazaguanine synthase QueE [Agriterribacter humi]